MDLTPFFAKVSQCPARDAFEPEEKKMPSAAAMANWKPPKWTGGTFKDFAPEAFMADPSRPLALYVHVPFCHHHCLFCPFYINRTTAGFSREYTELLLREIEITADALKEVIDKRAVATVYFGGGTPTDLDESDLSSVITALFDHFNIPKDAEVTVEGRTTGFTASKAKAWTAAGANRFSLGVQSANTILRQRLGRISSREELKSALDGICASGSSVIIDMLYGLPGQTREILLDDIRFISEETGIDGLDLYALKIFPGTPLDKAIQIGKMPKAPTFDDTATMFHDAYLALVNAGFEHFSPKHWRRNARERSLYNRLAGQQCDIIPFGSAAGGRLNAISLANARDIKTYRNMVEAGEKPLGHIMPSPLRPIPMGFDAVLASYAEKLALPPVALWPEDRRSEAEGLLTQWQAAGLLKDNGKEFCLTGDGYFWSQKMKGLIQRFLSEPVS